MAAAVLYQVQGTAAGMAPTKDLVVVQQSLDAMGAGHCGTGFPRLLCSPSPTKAAAGSEQQQQQAGQLDCLST